MIDADAIAVRLSFSERGNFSTKITNNQVAGGYPLPSLEGMGFPPLSVKSHMVAVDPRLSRSLHWQCSDGICSGFEKQTKASMSSFRESLVIITND